MRKLMLPILCGCASIAMVQGPGGAQQARREPPPDYPPSYQVHITPTGTTKPGTSTTEEGNYWIARGWSLQSMISEAWHIDPSRLDISDSVDRSKRYDFVMVLPQPEDRETLYRYVREQIPEQLHLRISSEPQPKDVSVMTAPGGMSPLMKPLPVTSDASSGFSGSTLSVTDHSVSGGGVDMEQLSRTLEALLGRPIVNESRIDGHFDVEAQGTGRGREALVTLLREKLGLILTPARRDIDFLVIRPAD